MSDVRDPTDGTAAPDVGTAPQSPGSMLKQERERQGITVQRIAVDMHLSVAVIEAIEQDRFASLGAPVFAKGHLRKYAGLLSLPVERVLELYHRLEDAPREVDPVPLSQRAPEPALRPGIREMLSPGMESSSRSAAVGPWIAAIVVLGFVVAIGWWFMGRSHRHTQAAASAAPSETVARDQPRDEQKPAESSTSTAQSTPPSIQPATPPESVNTTPTRTTRSAGSPPPGKVRVRLTFARESWVEVYDANGNKMIYEVGRMDSARTADIEPPVLVVLGDAEAVITEVNGKTLAIPRKNIQGTVARFTIAADGSVK